jgi:putative DNA primase/helicase
MGRQPVPPAVRHLAPERHEPGSAPAELRCRELGEIPADRLCKAEGRLVAFHDKTAHAARGKWKGILMALGVPDSCLTGKHGPCPFCAGTDRFRFLDKGGSGSWVCNQCRHSPPGTGVDFVMGHTGLPFADAAARVGEIVGNVTPDTPRNNRPEMTEEQRRRLLRSMWTEAKPLEDGDLVTRYLASRGLYAGTPELRFAPSVRDGEGSERPAMIARVLAPDASRVVTLHRTFLRPDGLAKAEMASPRKLAPGTIPEGAAIRLGPVADAMGIAEGIETALAAAQLFEQPVWAAISSAMLEKWTPPAGCNEVAVYADNDRKFGGQAAAYALAHRLSRDFDVTVKLTPIVGSDWNDVLRARSNRSTI